MSNDPILEIFREEAREHLGALEKSFLDLEATPTLEARRELIDHLFRHAHSLKGDAKVVGLDGLKDTAQELEDILDELRDKPESIDRAAIDRGLRQFDKVRAAFDAWQSAEVVAGPEPIRTPAIGSDAAPPDPPAAEPSIIAVSSEEAFTVRVPSERLDRMLNAAAEVRICQRSVESTTSRLAALREHLTAALKSLSQPAATESGVFEQQQALDAALEQVRQIDAELRKNSSREQLLIDGLEADIREARLLPLVMLTDTLRRAVRDLAQSLGKTIKYEAHVGHILLDKAVIEALKDPLLHLIRNAADHGLETADVRQAAGKAAEGTIRIEATQRGPLVSITVADDGRGVDFERIRQHLRRSGEVDADALAALTPQELGEFLFRPGFTTAPRGEISGRGVGLDVVQNTVRRLHGEANLHSSSAGGAVFAITVPVSISTVRVLSVLCGGLFYGVPTTSIRTTGRVRSNDLRDLAGNPILPLNGQPIPWVHLADLLGGQRTPRGSGQAWPYLLITRQGHELAVAVDDLEDESEVLLKPLGFPLHGLAGVLGATVRANGMLQLVLDLTSTAWGKVHDRPGRVQTQRKSMARILVVDDSPTTRAVLRNVFTAAGYSVTTATDGIDALERLRTRPVDVVISDVEMPRLNGFDLTRQIKSRFGLPVILVTGREKEEHRREGLHAGADAYIVKSAFQGNGLLEIVEQFV